jgi:hypothetical protein
MSSPPPEQEPKYTVELTTRQWQMIDGVVDNEVNTRAEEGGEGFVDTGLSVRQAGWDQVIVGSDIWPPDDQVVTVTLTIGQWGLIVSSLDIWVSITEDMDAHEGSAAARVIREVVSAQAGEQLPEWPIPGQGHE